MNHYIPRTVVLPGPIYLEIFTKDETQGQDYLGTLDEFVNIFLTTFRESRQRLSHRHEGSTVGTPSVPFGPVLHPGHLHPVLRTGVGEEG